jgi:hypothetical protein
VIDSPARWNLVPMLSNRPYYTTSVTFIFVYECGAKLESGGLGRRKAKLGSV